MLLSRPTTVPEALDCVDESDPANSRFYAGGLEVVFGLRTQALECRRLIDTKRIQGAVGVFRENGHVRLGPATTHDAISRDRTIHGALPLLGRACSQVGTLPIRTRGTIGGNFGYGHQHTDPGTAATLYGGSVTLVSRAGRRVVPFDQFWKGPYTVACEPGELIESVVITPLGPGWIGVHDRVEELHRPPTAIVSMAARLNRDATIAECRLAVGGVSSRPLRLINVEGAFEGHGQETIREASGSLEHHVDADVHAETDLLGSADFKVALVSGLIRRASYRLLCQTQSAVFTSTESGVLPA